MKIINTVFGIPLGYLMYLCYRIVHSYGWAIVLFTCLSKVIMFPISLSVQKNSIRMVKIQPRMDEINRRYAGDKDKIAEEQIKLYEQEGYSPALGCLPTLLQLPIIFGLINVIYNPIQHLLHFPQETIEILVERTEQILGVNSLGYGPQLTVIDTVHTHLAEFESLRGVLPNFEEVIPTLYQLDLSFWGIDLSKTPSISQPSLLIMIPVLSGLTALIMCLAQNKINVLQREQSIQNQWGMTLFLVVFSTYFPFIVPAGVGLYWIAGNIAAILVNIICNMIYDPRKYIDYENRSQKIKLSPEERKKKHLQDKENRLREKADSKRFYSIEDKQLVFYSAANGFYKYLENTLNYILEHSDIFVHYVTSDPADKIFERHHPRLIPYYIGPKALIPFMMKMDADIVVMTMPDLENYYIKRSLVRKDIEYIYTDHGMSSLHMGYREGALDHYDTIFCVGPQQVQEIRATERVYDLPAKKIVETGYGLLDNLIDAYEKMEKHSSTKKKILIAPSWQKDNIMESCLDPMLKQLVGQGYMIVVRPHPEFVKRFPENMQQILNRYQEKLDKDFIIETDFSSNVTIFTADLVITDWSGIALEFSYATKKPSLFINTPMKVMNPEYQRIGIEPLDITLRDKIGISLNPDQMDLISDAVANLFSHQADYAQQIETIVQENVFHIGHSGEIGGSYIIDALAEKAKQRDAEAEE